MAPKRKAASKATVNAAKANDALTPPDRETWPGWVEMESEPAFFNVMLKDMGVRGVKIQEVYGLDDEMLAFLPKPVHALIFLFRYRETDKDDLETECPDHIWYAEQVPDFACATVALLNIVNNIPGLKMSRDLRNFKDFTQDMTPRNKGEAIDDFTFVKRIHNSFAREADLLQANIYYQEKQARERKRQAVAKARKTRAANDARKANPASTVDTPKGTRTSARMRQPKKPSADVESTNGKATPPKKPQSTAATPSTATNKSGTSSKKSKSPATAKIQDANDVGTPSKKSKSPASTSTKANGLSPESDAELSETINPPKTNTRRKLKLNPPKNKTKSGDDYESGDEKANSAAKPRRSARVPKPRQTKANATVEAEDAEEAEEEGFHFCAYIPIGDRVWKLDGMDRFPQDMGPVEEGKDWLSVAQPALQGRMAQYEAGAIEFNLMAVVHDPKLACIDSLAANVKTIQAVEKKLSGVVEDGRLLLEPDNDTIIGQNVELGLQNVDIERVEIHEKDAKAISTTEDLSALIALRDGFVVQQSGLRAACRDEVDAAKSDDLKASTRRHDFSTFAREWVGALADQEVLEALIEAE
ncbi:hypothetical protein Q7P37_006901 [Cladosporium fusiforme]